MKSVIKRIWSPVRIALLAVLLLPAEMLVLAPQSANAYVAVRRAHSGRTVVVRRPVSRRVIVRGPGYRRVVVRRPVSRRVIVRGPGYRRVVVRRPVSRRVVVRHGHRRHFRTF